MFKLLFCLFQVFFSPENEIRKNTCCRDWMKHCIWSTCKTPVQSTTKCLLLFASQMIAFSRKDDCEIIIFLIALQSWYLNSKVDQAFMSVLKNQNHVRVRLGPELASLVSLSPGKWAHCALNQILCLQCTLTETKGSLNGWICLLMEMCLDAHVD